MTAAGIALRTLALMLFWLVLADVAGVLVCFVLDVAPLRYDSGALPYAIWFVLGAFTGFIAFGTAGEQTAPAGEGEWGTRQGARRSANIVVATGFALLPALGVLFNHLWWSRGVNGEYFVPDSAPHTITFFVAILLAMLIGRHAMVEERAPLQRREW
jgi:hypothetical protein